MLPAAPTARRDNLAGVDELVPLMVLMSPFAGFLIAAVQLGFAIAAAGPYAPRPEMAGARRRAAAFLAISSVILVSSLPMTWYFAAPMDGIEVTTGGSGNALPVVVVGLAGAVLSARSVYGRGDWSPLTLPVVWWILAVDWLQATWDPRTSEVREGLVVATAGTVCLAFSCIAASMVRRTDRGPRTGPAPYRQPIDVPVDLGPVVLPYRRPGV